MKKMRNLFACLSAATVLATCSLTASAITGFAEYPNYQKWASNYLCFTDEEKAGIIESGYYKDAFYKVSENPWKTTTYLVKSFTNEYVVFETSYTTWTSYRLDSTKYDVPTKEEISEFLKNNNLKAVVKEYGKNGPYTTLYELELTFDEDITYEEVQNVADALKSEYGFTVLGIMPCLSGKIEFEEEGTTPNVNLGTPTIAGDLDNDSTPGLTDVVKLTKYNANSELYPLTDATAMANADVNQDGTIDALDTNLLIEMVLGSYESAV